MQWLLKVFEPKELVYLNRAQMRDVPKEKSEKHKKLKCQRMPAVLQLNELDWHFLPVDNNNFFRKSTAKKIFLFTFSFL